MAAKIVYDEIVRLAQDKIDIRASIVNKGVQVPADASYDDMSGYIDQIDTSTPTESYTVKELIDDEKLTTSIEGTTLYVTVADGCPSLSLISDFVDVFMRGVKIEGLTYTYINLNPEDKVGEYRDILAANEFTIPFSTVSLKNIDLSNELDKCLVINFTTGTTYTYNDLKPFNGTKCEHLRINYSGDFSVLHNLFLGSNIKFIEIGDKNKVQSIASSDISGAFEFCSSLEYLPKFSWSSLTNIAYAFEMCSSLKRIEGNYTTRPLNAIAQAFNWCTNLEYVEPILDMSLVPIDDAAKTKLMFNQCNKLKHIFLKGIGNADWDFTTGNVINLPAIDDDSIRYIINNASEVTGLKVTFPRTIEQFNRIITKEEFNTFKAKGWSLYGTDGEVTDIGGGGKIDVATTGLKFGYSTALSSMLDFSNCTNFDYMFVGSVIKDFSIVDSSNVTSMNHCFYDSRSDYPALNTSNVRNMAYCLGFSSAEGNKKDINGLSSWDVSKVSDFSYCFQYRSYLNDGWLDEIKDWDVSSATNMNNMFRYANRYSGEGYGHSTDYSLLNDWNTSNVTDMAYCFYYNSMMTVAPAWDTSKATTLNNMFVNCPNLKTVPAYNGSLITSMSNAQLFSTSSTQPKTVTSFGGLIGTKYGYSVEYMTNLTVESLMNIINGLYDFSDGTPHTTANATMTLGATNLAKLTDEQKAIATDKGWILK